jgi:hypothetical protein
LKVWSREVEPQRRGDAEVFEKEIAAKRHKKHKKEIKNFAPFVIFCGDSSLR